MTKAEYEAKYQEALSHLRFQGYFVDELEQSGGSRRVRITGIVYDDYGVLSLAWGKEKASEIIEESRAGE